MASEALATTDAGTNVRGRIRARDGLLVDGDGTPRVLRGVGLGNWLLPEGYMWRFGMDAQSPRQIEAAIERVAGADYAERFWTEFRARFITEADIRAIARAGFDHVRLPINARVIQDEDGTMLPDGLRLIDDCLRWCRAHDLYLLLDLHGAPGGQTGTNIDDSPRGRPELFESEHYRRLTIDLWRALARRYRGDEHILGYDLLNEPLPHEWQHRYADELIALYRDLTAAIRAEDPDTLLMYEGSHWATNWSIFTEVWDDNAALQFHKYWSPPDRASLADYLEARDRLGLPIYMGEGGENTPDWLYAVTRLYESEGIGWNLWPWKKLETSSSPVSVVPPEGWWGLVDAVDGREEMDPARARGVLDEYLEAIDVDACVWQQHVFAAVFALWPASVPAWGYAKAGCAGEAPATADADAAHVRVPDFRAADPAPVSFAGAAYDNPFDYSDSPRVRYEERMAVTLRPGDWLEYRFAGDVDPEAWAVIGPAGPVHGVTLTHVERGLRLSVPTDGEDVSVVRLARGPRRARMPS